MIRQFEVVRNPNQATRGRVPYLMVLQSHHLHVLATVVVAPLVRSESVQADGLVSLSVLFGDESLTLAVGLMANIEQRVLGPSLGSLLDQEFDIRRAIDRLFTGF